MAEYNKLKSMLLDMQPRTFTDGEANAMDQRRTLVDTMFKYIDRNQDGRLSSEELAEVRGPTIIFLHSERTAHYPAYYSEY